MDIGWVGVLAGGRTDGWMDNSQFYVSRQNLFDYQASDRVSTELL